MANPYDPQTIATVTTSGAVSSTNQTAVAIPMSGKVAVIVGLDVTAAATDAGDTLDVKVQCLMDGTNWVDVVYFTQVIGNGGVKYYAVKLSALGLLAETDVNTALTAGNIRNCWAEQWRVNYTVVDADANSAFTFKVFVMPLG